MFSIIFLYAGYLPACLACAFVLYKHPGKRLGCLIAMALNPALIIIDHGHFQYNGISLGTAVRPLRQTLCCSSIFVFASFEKKSDHCLY